MSAIIRMLFSIRISASVVFTSHLNIFDIIMYLKNNHKYTLLSTVNSGFMASNYVSFLSVSISGILDVGNLLLICKPALLNKFHMLLYTRNL